MEMCLLGSYTCFVNAHRKRAHLLKGLERVTLTWDKSGQLGEGKACTFCLHTSALFDEFHNRQPGTVWERGGSHWPGCAPDKVLALGQPGFALGDRESGHSPCTLPGCLSKAPWTPVQGL